MFCLICRKELHRTNKIGACRTHRGQSPIIKEKMKKYAMESKDKCYGHKRKYREKNRERLNQEYYNKLKNPEFKLIATLRNRINRALKRQGLKSRPTIEMLGCSKEELKCYIESKFKEGMNWDNHGIRGWHMDHINSLNSYDLSNEDNLKKACHYTNLQPLWYYENIAKRLEDNTCKSVRQPI